jgi:hypothetical protein
MCAMGIPPWLSPDWLWSSVSWVSRLHLQAPEVVLVKTRVVITQLLVMLFLVDVEAQSNPERIRERARLYEPLIAAAAARYSVDPHLLWTIAYLESRFDPRAVSYKNGRPCSFGLMQFIPATARRYGLVDPHDPTRAVDAAARYVVDLLKRFGGRGDLVLAAYNAGEGTVEAFRDGKRLVLMSGKIINPRGIRKGGIPPYRETQQYVARGSVVYQIIVRQGIFSSLNKTSRLAATDAPRSGPDPRGASESIYISTADSLVPSKDKIAPKRKTTQRYSLYID